MTGSPPRAAVLLLRVVLPRRLRDEALEDLAELHAARVARAGKRAADRAYWTQLPGFVLRLHVASIGGRLDGHPASSVPRGERREWMSTLLSEARYSLRTLLRNPGFTIIAVMTLAVGIGANTAIFGVIRTVLLRPLPFPDADRIVQIWETRLDLGRDRASFTHANFWDVHDLNRTFEAMGALAETSFVLTGLGGPEQLSGASVSASFFRVLGMMPSSGRTFAAGEDAQNADARVVVLGHEFWTRRFAGDPSVIGRTLTLDGQNYSVIGVLPRGRPWLDRADVFVPFVRRSDANRGSFELSVIGRLKPEVTFEAALTDLESVAARLAELYPGPDEGMGIRMESSSGWIADEALRRALWILMGGAGLLLLVACVNVANLMLARATGQSRERALRAALGASRPRIVRLAVTESLLIGLSGALLGVGIALVLTRLLRTYNPGDIPRLADVTIDGWVLAFAAAVALVTSLVTGLVPALRTQYRSVVSALREGDRSVMGTRHQGRLRAMLVATEVAISLVLLVGAGLLLRSFTEVLRADRGFQTENRLFFEVALPPSYAEDGNARATQFQSEFLSRINSLDPVISAAAINVRPMRGVNVGMGFAAADNPPPADQPVPWASWRLITRDYFRTMGVPLLAGRDFTEQDVIEQPWRAMISQRIARELWPGENAVGRTISLWHGGGPQAEVIGVVADMLDWGLEAGPSYAVYLPSYGAGWREVQFVLHTTAPPSALVPGLRSMLAEIDPSLPFSNVQTLDEMVGANVASRTFTMMLLVTFAGVALLLALAGIYGVLSYTVAQRKSEIGTRLALGATEGSVLRLIVGQGMVPVVVGLMAGVLVARALSGLMSSLLFEVTPADLGTYVAGAAVLMLTAVMSCLVPVKNAVASNVISALREE